MGGAPKKNRVNKNRILAEINPKCFRTPVSNGSNGFKVCSSLCKRSGTARSQRLTGYVVWEELAKTRDEPVTSRYTVT
jgi:hypothetical protein